MPATFFARSTALTELPGALGNGVRLGLAVAMGLPLWVELALIWCSCRSMKKFAVLAAGLKYICSGSGGG